MNILVQVFIGTYTFISPGHMPRSGIAESCVNLMVSILRNCQTCFLKWLQHFTFLPSMDQSSGFSTTKLHEGKNASLRFIFLCWGLARAHHPEAVGEHCLACRDSLSPCFSLCTFCFSFLGTQLGVSASLKKCRKTSTDAGRQPFSGKSFYLDLPAGKSLQFLTGAIQQLGGVRNLLLTCDMCLWGL